MNDQQMEKYVEKSKGFLLKAADAVPLPLHYLANGLLLIFWLGDLFVPDFLPFVDEIMGAAGLYYYNAYLLKRTFGVINPMRIIRGESPAAKRRMGLLPYEKEMEQIKKQLKALGKASRDSQVPGLDPAKLKSLTGQIKKIEKRLLLLDRLLSRREFQEGSIKTEIARIDNQREAVDDPEIKQEYGKAIEHARNHLANIERLREERNRLVARLERFHLQIDDTYSRVVAMSVDEVREEDAGRLFDELFASINAFDQSLQELEKKPDSELFAEAVREVEETEARMRDRRMVTKTD